MRLSCYEDLDVYLNTEADFEAITAVLRFYFCSPPHYHIMEATDRLELRYEVARKAIHLSSLSIPVLYWFISRELALLLLVPLFCGFFVIDLLKNFFKPVATWYHTTFGSMLRTHELEGSKLSLNGATNIILAALLLVLFFPKIIAVTAFTLVAISDTLAAIVGKIFGKHRFGHKSVEGSVAFLVSALLIVNVVPGLPLLVGVLMAITATLAEAFFVRIGDVKIDDNLSIPLVSATVGVLSALLLL